MKLKSIDFLKGLLILLVITGHILQGNLPDSFGRYIIYSFHMPLFIGISGYLFSYNKIGILSLSQVVKKYFSRIVIPWAIAVVVYSLINNKSELHSVNSYKIILNSFVFPFYHLWFVLGYLSWIGISWLCFKLKLSIKNLLIFSFLISFVSYIFNSYPEVLSNSKLSFLLKIIQNNFRLYFYFFFVLGTYLREKQEDHYLFFFNLMLALGIFGIVLLFFYPNKIESLLAFFLLNTSLLYILLKKAAKEKLLKSKPIEWIGRNSLGIYLWHVAGIILIKEILGTNNLLLFYSVVIGVEIILILLIYQLSRIKLINKYLFGIA